MKSFTLTADDATEQNIVNNVHVSVRTLGLRYAWLSCCDFDFIVRFYTTNVNGGDPQVTSPILQGTNGYLTGDISGIFVSAAFCNNNCGVARILNRVTIAAETPNACGDQTADIKICICTCTNQTFNSNFPSDVATCDGATCIDKYVVA